MWIFLIVGRLAVLELHKPRKVRNPDRDRVALRPWVVIRALFVFVDSMCSTAAAVVVLATPLVPASAVEDLAKIHLTGVQKAGHRPTQRTEKLR